MLPTRIRPGVRLQENGGGRRWWWRVAGAATGVACVIAVLLVVWWPKEADPQGTDDPTASTVEPIWDRPAVGTDELVQRSGVRITQVAVTGNGGLVDLRFQVVDPRAANALHDPSRPPAIIDQQTGLVVHSLLMNHAHTGTFHHGQTYYLVF